MQKTILLLLCTAFLGLAPPMASAADSELPLSVRFKGQDKFHRIVTKARSENWANLPIGDRMIKFGRELHGLPYTSFTLEIDDHIEAPSVNLYGLDCWSFFEISLGFSRMIVQEKEQFVPQDLLDQILLTRYRGGVCSGNYLERIHYLSEWFFDNEARGVADDITKDFKYAMPMTDRKCQEMTILWKSYRYLKNNPDLRPTMSKLEAKVSQLPVYYIPKDKVKLIEPQLKDGDILGIATTHQGGFCSHVGLAIRTNDGVLRLMHATSQKQYRRVIIDKSISDYLNHFKGHAGVIVARPWEVDKTVTDPAIYKANLKRLTGGRGMITMKF
ncbi:MAG: N-acetylmuramoyl-L-alanine amidase-like domain-containing protein [Verrucomicrobiota bacterium]